MRKFKNRKFTKAGVGGGVEEGEMGRRGGGVTGEKLHGTLPS